jgi:hypothetical protein
MALWRLKIASAVMVVKSRMESAAVMAGARGQDEAGAWEMGEAYCEDF